MDTNVDYIIGFDFGHGETSVSMVDVNAIDKNAANLDTEDLHIVGDKKEVKIPSIIGYDVDGNKLLNFDAYQFRFLQIGAYFKAPMCASEKFPAISAKDKEYFKDFATMVFKCLHSHPKNQKLQNKRILYFVACPSGWNIEQQKTYLNFFQEYCDLPIEGIIEESRAAYVVARRKLYDRDPKLSELGSKIAVLDLGSSTLDITMHSDKAYTDGFEIGASLIEVLLLDYFLNTDEVFREKYNRYHEIEPTCKNQILFLLREAKEDYYNKLNCERSVGIALKCQIDWEELSADEISGNSILKLKGSELERLLRAKDNKGEEYEDKLKNDITSFINTHGKANAVVLTGGASQMSFYRDVVLNCYGLTEHECVIDDNPSYSISRGTAIMGYLDLRNKKCKSSKIDELIESIPDLIKKEIIKSTCTLYADSLIAIVREWQNQSGIKNIKILHENLTKKLDYWQSHYEEVNKAINQQIEDEVSSVVENALAEIIRLYFGFNAQMHKIRFGCQYDVAITDEQNQMLKTNLYKNYRKIINESALFTRYSEPESTDKDRTKEPKILKLLTERTIDYISRWFKGFTIDDEFDDIIKVCQKKTKDYYKDYIKFITCQI